MSRHENVRAHYRVVFPTSARPRFREFGIGAEHEVIDCSEKGVRYRSSRPPIPAIGSEVEGTIEFTDGEHHRIAGIVVRTAGDEVALHLTIRPIPFTRIIQQQRYLRQKFPLNELIP
ncbi:MAG TPA: PilZ domain-containing protein [Longimicrobiaceae bacterium]